MSSSIASREASGRSPSERRRLETASCKFAGSVGISCCFGTTMCGLGGSATDNSSITASCQPALRPSRRSIAATPLPGSADSSASSSAAFSEGNRFRASMPSRSRAADSARIEACRATSRAAAVARASTARSSASAERSPPSAASEASAWMPSSTSALARLARPFASESSSSSAAVASWPQNDRRQESINFLEFESGRWMCVRGFFESAD